MFRIIVLLLALITACLAVEVQAQDEDVSPEAVFESMWETFDRHYALFEAKSIDWRALHDVYRPRVSSATTDEELFAVLTGMLSHLNDTHVILQAESLGRDFSAGCLGAYFEELGLAGALELLSQHPLPERYFRGEPRYAGGGGFQFGQVGEGIGYLHFHGFNDPAASAAAVDSILAAFEGSRGLIVDVRMNSGGDDRVGKVIADRFADRRRLYMVVRDRNGPGHGDFAEPRYWHLEPAARTFTRPVILLTSRLSVSAAENFALALRVLPHVTLVGDFTSGCFADMAWHELPNGWRISLSRNHFVDHAGRCWEGIGVPPDLMVRSGEDPEDGRDRVLEFALALFEGGGPSPHPEDGSAAAAQIPLVEKLGRDLESEGFAAARRAFVRARRELPPGSWCARADELNALGYRLLAAERLDDAVGVFELYVELYPDDANAHDSLGEGYMMRGDRERAVASYERSLALDPGNRNAVKMLEKLER